jgi:haloalkane dehalogenase
MSALPQKQFQEVLGKRMAYVDVGEGEPIVLLHGNPTSSYLWRNILPHLSDLGRCVVPDLIGMGDSDKIDASDAGSYRFVHHRDYLDELLYELEITEKAIFVIHDWGSVLGFDWANRHREAMSGIVYMEAIVRPLTWQEWPPAAVDIFKALRTPGGESMILDKNVFVERILPASILRQLSDDEMAAYREPFAEPGEGRRPTLTWPRQIPLNGEPEDVVGIVRDYSEWLSGAKVPKLFINAEPGSILTGEQREFCRGFPNQTEVTVAGSHFVQEDSPDEIGEATAEFVRNVRAAELANRHG